MHDDCLMVENMVAKESEIKNEKDKCTMRIKILCLQDGLLLKRLGKNNVITKARLVVCGYEEKTAIHQHV